jgi:hypothetical protein
MGFSRDWQRPACVFALQTLQLQQHFRIRNLPERLRTTRWSTHHIRVAEEEVCEMEKRKRRIRKALALILGGATLTLLSLPGTMRAQSTATQDAHAQGTATQDGATQDRQAVRTDDITRRDLAQFDQFLDNHREIAGQLRRTPSLIDDPQYLQSHSELNAYLEDHPSVKQEISQQPNTFMRLEDLWARDRNQRDRDAGGQDRDAWRLCGLRSLP